MGTRQPKLTEMPAADAVTIPADLESAQSKLVYLSLANWETATADQLCERLRLSKGSLLAIMDTLTERGHVEKADGCYRVVRS